MGDQQQAAAPQGVGTPPQQPTTPAASGQQPASGTTQPKYVTLEEAQQLANQAADAAFKRAQGLYEKGRQGFEQRVQEEIRNFEKALEIQKAAGVAFTPEQVTAFRQQALNQAFMGTDQNPPSGSPGQPPAQDGGEDELELDPVTATAYAMMTRAGIDINAIPDDDPDLKLIDDKTEDEFTFLQSINAFIAAKRQSVGGGQLGTQQPPASPARTPTNLGGAGAQVNPVTNTWNMDELWKMTGLSK